MAGKSYKYVAQTTTVLSAIDNFFSELESLAEEAREVFDAIPESLQQGDRATTFESTADTLEGLQAPDAPNPTPDGLDLPINVQQATPRSRADRTSRAVRLENACAMGSAGVAGIQAWLETNEELNEQRDEQDEGTAETLREEWSSYADELERAVGEAEGCEFPGMYS